jgi:hypothetical protein
MIDKAYQERFTEGLMTLIIQTSIIEQPDQPRTAMIRAYELIDSMLSMIAVLSATSAETSSPTRTRALCDEMARKLRIRTNEAKLLPSPFGEVLSGVPN